MVIIATNWRLATRTIAGVECASVMPWYLEHLLSDPEVAWVNYLYGS